MVIVFPDRTNFDNARNVISIREIGVQLGEPRVSQDGRCACSYDFTDQQVSEIQTGFAEDGISAVINNTDDLPADWQYPPLP